MVTLPVPINLLSRRGLIGNECCDTRSLICLLPAALFWYWQPAAVAQSISRSLRRPALQYACTRHNEQSTDTISYCVRIGLRLVCLPVHRQCSHLLRPGLFPGVTPFPRAGGAHVVPETLSLHMAPPRWHSPSDSLDIRFCLMICQ